jgi:Na+-driven multidrug efflux pump
MLEVLPYFSWKHVREIFVLGIPRTGVNVLTQVRIIFFTGFATTLGPGILSSYLFAQRITEAASQVVQQSVTTASLPVLSKEFIENKIHEYKQTVRLYVGALGLIGVIISLAIYGTQDIIVWVLYDSTPFESMIRFFLVGFLIIFPFQMMTGYFSISLYSIKDTKSVFYSNLVASLIAVIVCYSTQEQGVISLVYGVVAMSIINFLLIFTLYSRKRL